MSQYNLRKALSSKKVVYLAHVISNEGLPPEVSKISESIFNNIPKNIKEIRRCCGVINWFRPYIHNLSMKLEPITNMTRRGIKIQWNKDHTNIIQDIGKDILNCAILRYQKFLKPFDLETDASETGVGAVLFQKKGVIGFFSKKFTGMQSRYMVSEKELLAIILASSILKV